MTWTKGRAILLAGALLFLASWITFEVAGDQNANVVPFQSQIDNSQLSGNLPNSSFTDSASDTTSTTAAAAGVIGLVFLATGAVLDRRGLRGTATPFIAVGAFEAIIGAIVLGGNESVLLAGFLAVGAGAVVGLVGGHGDQRRATTWIGVLTVFGGFVAIMVDIAPDSGWSTGGIALGFALIFGCIAWFLAPVLGEPDDGNDLPVPPLPPAPTSDADTTDAGNATVVDGGLAPPETEPDPEPVAVGATTQPPDLDGPTPTEPTSAEPPT
jgi:MFS family permease